MLDKGIIERIVLDYKDIYKQALEDNIQSPAELPYFEGDFWPNVMEENIRELEQEEEMRKRVSGCFVVVRNVSSPRTVLLGGRGGGETRSRRGG